ncbi:MAG: hypothetical protein IKV53_02380 [Clostridia bacterium]|nr:hypothetical protein [Clostridia bacterium]
MENFNDKFNNLFESSQLRELLALLEEIKKADKKTGKRMTAISFIASVSMAILGYFAIGLFGAVIFFVMVYTAAFYMNYSLKKRNLLAYLKVYRERLPQVLCSESSKIDKPRYASTLNLLYPDTLHHWTVCYSVNGIDTGFVRIQSSANESASGMAAVGSAFDFEGSVFKGYFPALTDEYIDELYVPEGTDSRIAEFARLLDSRFQSFAIVCGDEYSVLFIPSAQDFMTSRIEYSDGLSRDSLARQVGYFDIARAFETLDVNALSMALTPFETEDE